MARAHENDLRRKFLGAYDRGEGTLEKLAGVFGVSLGWAKKISSQRKRTYQAERVRHQPGSQVAGWLRSAKTGVRWVESQPDLTLVEIQAKLWSEAGIDISRGRVWYLLRKLGLRLKKSRSTPNSGTQKRTASGARSSSRSSAGSI